MPLYQKQEFKDGGKIAVWHITETEENLKEIASVPSVEQEDIEQMAAPQRRLRAKGAGNQINKRI